MNVLVTGGAGYIGTHTCVELIDDGHAIIVADNFSNSKPEAVHRVKAITKADFPVYGVDVCDKPSLEQIFTENQIDAVVHLAGLKAVGESVVMPLEYYKTNINATLTLLEVMKEHGVNIFHF